MATLAERARAIADAAKAVPLGCLTLVQFAASGRQVVLASVVLGEEIIFAADNAHVPEGETRPVYRARELAGLHTWTPDGLRLLHEVKTWFGGEVMEEGSRTHGKAK